MDQQGQSSRSGWRHGLRTPRAAAVAGIVFSIVFAFAIVMLHFSVASREALRQDWFALNAWRLNLVLNLAPFAGIAFLWFIGVLRDRLGEAEDRFFATVFWSSAVLFLAMFFASTAVLGGVVHLLDSGRVGIDATGACAFGQALSAQLLNVFALKMAAVLMITTATLGMRTGFLPRGIALPGYALAAILLACSHFLDWFALGFPLWIFAVSAYILIDNYRGSRPARG